MRRREKQLSKRRSVLVSAQKTVVKPQNLTELGTLISANLRELDEVIGVAREMILTAATRSVETQEPYIGKVEAAKFLNMSVSTLERRMAEKLGPPRYIDGGKVNFLRSDLKQWRAKWRVGNT